MTFTKSTTNAPRGSRIGRSFGVPIFARDAFKRKCKTLQAFCKGCPFSLAEIVDLGNEAAQKVEEMPGLANEFTVLQDEWVLIPYGEASVMFQGRTIMQVFARDDAEVMVANFQSVRARLNRLFGGLPWFVGHPDNAAFASKYKDFKAYGWIMQLEVRPDGLAMFIKWNDDGQNVIKQAHYKYFSQNWKAEVIRQPGGGTIARPVILKSVGFTNEPNWPVAPLANEKHTEDEEMEWLKTMLGLGNEATDEQVQAKAQEMKTAADAQAAGVTALANEKTAREAADGQVATLSNEKTIAATNLVTVTAARETAETAFANERAAHITLILGNAVADGRLKPADEAAMKTGLEADFETKSAELANMEPTVKVTSRLGDLGTRQSKETSRSTQIQELVNERMDKCKMTYHDAFLAVKTDQPDLFRHEAPAE